VVWKDPKDGEEFKQVCNHQPKLISKKPKKKTWHTFSTFFQKI